MLVNFMKNHDLHIYYVIDDIVLIEELDYVLFQKIHYFNFAFLTQLLMDQHHSHLDLF